MAQSGKRASMREGPLTALFRKTEEDDQSTRGDEAKQGADTAAQETGERSKSDAKRVSEPDAKRASQPDAKRPSGQDEPVASGAAGEREAEKADKTVGVAGRQEREPEERESRVPSPQERLRNVFSSDIPENVMERLATDSPSAGSRPSAEGSRTVDAAVDVYARAERPRGLGEEPREHRAGDPVIRVVGVGGAGVNAVNRMVEAEVQGVEFLAVNTDLQSLQQSTADVTLHIGAELTRGLGSGSDTGLGRQAAMDDYDRAKALLKGSDMVFITAGAGGGTGTGAAPIVARIAREVGALTVAIVTKPFGFEGSRRAEQAEQGVAALAEEVDTLIVVPNNRLLSVLDKQTSMVDAFRVADDVLRQGVQGISDLVTLPGLINLDFADVRTIMSGAGNALLGIGMGAGAEHRATEAAMQAVSSPLLETSMEGARSILLSITGGRDLSLWEVNEAAKAVSEAAHPDANIIFGAMVDEKLEDQVWVTVVATGYDDRTSRSGRGRLREPAGDRSRETLAAGSHPRSGQRVQRAASSSRGERRGSSAELEVPEFMPRV
jgi:cell division protein FtsZ